MALIVQKFGGTSLGTIKKIKDAAKIIAKENTNNKVVVVVSAMAGETNRLVTLCNEFSQLQNEQNLAEYDFALSSGEIVSASLLALALQELGYKARSFSGWQIPISTNENYSSCYVKNINIKLIQGCLSQDIIPVITGFQGVDQNNRITTLGRGGSDTTASVVAAALQANRCDIYTDVEGVFSADPRIVHDAKLLDKVHILEMLELAGNGAKVLHPRSVEIAMRYNISLRVLSSFKQNKGTLITNNIQMENNIITGITYNKNLLKVDIEPSHLQSSMILHVLAQENIVTEVAITTGKNYALIVNLNCLKLLESKLNELKSYKKIKNFKINNEISLITIVGFGIKTNPTLLKEITEILLKINIEIIMINISEIKISILISEDKTELCIKTLHVYFNDTGILAQ